MIRNPWERWQHRLPWPARLLGLMGLILWMTCVGCAIIRNPPAASTPVREARYYRTRDLPNFALGAACEQTFSFVITGPDLERDRRPWAPLVTIGLCAVGAVIQRSVDKGYRESGGLFVISGALARRIVWMAWKAATR